MGPARAGLSPAAKEAFDRLLVAERFESAHIGYAGSLSDNAKAVRTLIREPDAPAAFQALFDHGTSVSRLYALAAFWYLRPEAFPRLVESVQARDGTRTVKTQHGCIGMSEAISSILESKERSAVRLKPGTGLYAYMCAHQNAEALFEDVVGGAVPINIVEGAAIMLAACADPPALPSYLLPRSKIVMPKLP
jgi:hypothetical protein